jgi:hypothetical protein
LRQTAFHPAQNIGAFTTGNRELIEIEVLHQPKQRQALAGAGLS